MHVIVSDGTRLHVEESGPSTAPVTVMLAHGWTLDERCWEPVARVLSSNARVIRYDHRAHGRSDDTPESRMTLDRLADDLAELIAQVCPSGPLVLVGHSMGGMTTMALAQRHPRLVASRVAGVALLSTASGGLSRAATLGMTGLPARAFLTGRQAVTANRRWTERRELTRRPRLFDPAVRALLLGRHPDARAVRLTRSSIADCRPTTLSGFTPTLTAHSRDAALAAFADLPVEIMVGSRDRLTPPRLAHRIHGHLPRASTTVFADAGRMLPVERVDGVASRIAALVTRATGPSSAPAAVDQHDSAPAGARTC